MEKRTSLYVSRKNVLTWLMALCLVCSAVARIVIFGEKGTEDSLYVWGQIVLPIAAALLYVLITLINGKELFYKTAIPVWMMAIYCAICLKSNGSDRSTMWLYCIALIFFASAYTEITSGRRHYGILLLFPVVAAPLAFVLYHHRGAFLAANWSSFMHAVPDILALFGVLLVVFAVRPYPTGEYHPTWGDRIDGRKIRTLAPMAQITAYFQWERNICSNFFEESFEDDDIYEEGMDAIDDSRSQLKAIGLEVTFGVKSGYLTSVLMDLEGVEIEVTLSDFGKAELDYDELDDLASECKKGYEEQWSDYYD